MNNLEINKLIHEKVMNLCWHEWRKASVITDAYICLKCKLSSHLESTYNLNPSYTSLWADYGPMLERAERQIWWSIFAKDGLPAAEKLWFLFNPLRGSTALAEFVINHPEHFKKEPLSEE